MASGPPWLTFLQVSGPPLITGVAPAQAKLDLCLIRLQVGQGVKNATIQSPNGDIFLRQGRGRGPKRDSASFQKVKVILERV